jgi:hypothetical protein
MKRKTLFLVSVIGAAALGSSPARAAETCYGFSGLPNDKTFVVGDTHEAQHLKMVVRPYVWNGSQLAPEGRFIKVQNTNRTLSNDTELSELYIYGVNMQIVPRQPVAQIRFRVAENDGPGNGNRNENIQINGKVHEISGSLRSLDGKTLDDENGRQYRIEVKLRQNSDGSAWFSGPMRVRAVSGEIRSFSIGSSNGMGVDDVCITPNAP